jgi:hypothetical protein
MTIVFAIYLYFMNEKISISEFILLVKKEGFFAQVNDIDLTILIYLLDIYCFRLSTFTLIYTKQSNHNNCINFFL